MVGQWKPDAIEPGKALSPSGWNSACHKEAQAFYAFVHFLVYFSIPSHIFKDALCGNVSLSRLRSREQGKGDVRPALNQPFEGKQRPLGVL